MGTAKLMTPLFYDGNYNVEKKRMRIRPLWKNFAKNLACLAR